MSHALTGDDSGAAAARLGARRAAAAPRHPEIGDRYTAPLINYGFLANAVLTTDDAVKAMR